MSVDLEEGRLSKESILAAIPPFPPIVSRVLTVLATDRPELVPLVEAISSDPVFSAQLLRLANSPLIGLPAQVDSVHRAAIKLGFIHIQSLVMTLAAANYQRAASPTDALRRCWRHALASAVLSRELGRAANMPADRMYTFGLLHDFGRLGLLAAFPDEYSELLRAADRGELPLTELERRRFGMDHCEAGTLLVELWKLPAELAFVAGHQVEAGGIPLDFLRLVRLACQMADSLGYHLTARRQTASFDDLRQQIPLAALEQFPTEPDMLRQMIESVLDQDQALDEVPLHPPHRAVLAPAAEPDQSPLEPVPPPRKSGPASWDPGVILLVAMMVLVLVAGALCLRNS